LTVEVEADGDVSNSLCDEGSFVGSMDLGVREFSVGREEGFVDGHVAGGSRVDAPLMGGK
jgi:hypothetical protein